MRSSYLVLRFRLELRAAALALADAGARCAKLGVERTLFTFTFYHSTSVSRAAGIDPSNMRLEPGLSRHAPAWGQAGTILPSGYTLWANARRASQSGSPIMKTQYYTATSLDGFIATEDDSLEWLFSLGDVNDTSYPSFIKDVGALAMGRTTYEWMLRNVIRPGTGGGEPWPYAQPTWVFCHRPCELITGVDVRFTTGDVRPVHAEMAAAAGGKNLWLVGGGDLVGQFHDAGLLDEIIVQVGSVTLGRGKPLLPRRITNPSLHLTEARAIGPGFAELRYEVLRPARG